MINVLADKYLYNIQSYLPESVNLRLFDPDQGLPTEVKDTHALLIRTVIPINKETLPNIPKNLHFIGTGSSGTDHVDRQYLKKNNIHFADAAGCNAQSVAEYVATALLLWAEERNRDLSGLSAGIIGVGHAGTKVIDILSNIGLKTVAYDPPRQQRDQNFSTASLDDVLSCDILSFHTPLTKNNNYPTCHWLNKSRLEDRTFDLIINSSRGGVINEKDLLAAMKKGVVRDIIIDTWEDEPRIHLETAGAAFLKTPHIAGYSIKAKENATKAVVNKLTDFFDLNHRSGKTNRNKQIIFKKENSQFDSLSSLLIQLHPIKEYENKLTDIIKNHPQNRGKLFNNLRADFPLRHQFDQIKLPENYFSQFPLLKELGFAEVS